ncbi:MAG: glycosyltransferase family 39 protein, partial [Caldilineaceae bacterium]|nr:glycosyltransferase family 39 protein [Caldilineaceae bacterium]
SDDSGLLVNLVALGMLLVATYALGTAAAGPRAGLLSAIVLGSYPILIGLVHILLVETVMVLLVALTLLALWRSEGFHKAGWSSLAGVLTGLGLLTKVFFVLFVIGPWLVTMWIAWRQSVEATTTASRRTRIFNLLVALLYAFALAGIWYAYNWRPMLARSMSAAVGAEGALYGPTDPLQWRNLWGYFLSVVGLGLAPFGFLLFLWGVVGLFKAPTQRDALTTGQGETAKLLALFLTSSLVLGYAVFTTLPNQDLKHVTGILPAIAVLTGWGVTVASGRRWRLVTALATLIMVAQVLLATVPGALTGKIYAISIFEKPLVLLYGAQPWHNDTRYAAPNRAAWPIREVLQYALAVTDWERLERDRIRVAAIDDAPGIEEYALRFEAYRQQMPIAVGPVSRRNLADYDILIHKTGVLGWSPRQAEAEQVLIIVENERAGYSRLPRTFPLPDGTEVHLYAAPSLPLVVSP